MFISKYKLVSKPKKDNNISYYTKRKKLAMFHIKNYLFSNDKEDLLRAFNIDNTNEAIVSLFLLYIDTNKNFRYKEYEIYSKCYNYLLTDSELQEIKPKGIDYQPKISYEHLIESLLQTAIAQGCKILNKDYFIHHFNPPINPFLISKGKSIYTYKHIFDINNENEEMFTTKYEIRPLLPLNFNNDTQFHYLILYYLLTIALCVPNEINDNTKSKEVLEVIQATYTYYFKGILVLLKKYNETKSLAIKESIIILSIFKLELQDYDELLKQILYECKKHNIELEKIPSVLTEKYEITNQFNPLNITKYANYSKEIKTLLVSIAKSLLNSELGKSLIKDMYGSQYDSDFDSCLEELIQVGVFFNEDFYGLSLKQAMICYIDISKRHISKLSSLEPINFFYHWGIWIVTLMHEVIGHCYRGFLYYKSNLKTNYNTPEAKAIKNDGGYYIESLLFDTTSLTIPKIIYILRNFDKNHEQFKQGYLAIDNNKATISNDYFNETVFVSEMKKIINFEYKNGIDASIEINGQKNRNILEKTPYYIIRPRSCYGYFHLNIETMRKQ